MDLKDSGITTKEINVTGERRMRSREGFNAGAGKPTARRGVSTNIKSSKTITIPLPNTHMDITIITIRTVTKVGITCESASVYFQ